MISLSYYCKQCGWESGVLQDAQLHADVSRHHVSVRGFLTPCVVQRAHDAPEAIKERAREREIMRRARDRGLLK